MRRSFLAASIAVVCLVAARPAHAPAAVATGCDPDNAGLKLPPGFCAGVFARVPAPRHIVVASNGDVFVISQTGNARQRGATGPERGVYRLRDANGDGKADSAEFVAAGTGSGIWVTKDAVYAEGGGTVILRHPFKPGTTDLTGAVDTIVSGLPGPPDHTSRDFVIRGTELFVNVGSGSNICELGGGRTGQPVTHPDPCPELPTRAGIWLFSATQKNQVFSPAQRYVTGLRNGVGITLNPTDNQVYSTQHGRDEVGTALGKSAEYNAENPAEEFHKIVKGANYGWPYCYYSVEEKKKVTGPEFGGDGKKDDRCRDTPKPIYAFPGHWAPNASMFYTGTQFPAEYRNGLFVAFHGSWDRGPQPTDQRGFNVTFLPMRNGAASGPHRVFADGFNPIIAMPQPPPPWIEHRPSGLAQAKDGALLVTDDQSGFIYRIVYAGR